MDFLARWLHKLVAVGALLLPLPRLRSCLLYADDALFFLQPHIQQCHLLKTVLLGFQAVSGLTLNPSKSDLLLTTSNQPLLTLLSHELGCKASSFPITYLGLPLSDRKLKKDAFLPLHAKFRSKLTGWTASLLSFAGRLVLLKACLSALPIYYMSVLRLSKWVLDQIDKIRRTFLWKGPSGHDRKLIMIAWEKICRPKKVGRLGVLDLQAFNLSLFSKWLWRYFALRSSLLSSLFLDNFPSADGLLPAGSPLTKTFLQVWPLFSVGFSFHLNSGGQAPFWLMDWGMGVLKFRYPQLSSFAIDPSIKVNDFLQQCWSSPLALFMPSLSSTALPSTQLQSLLQLLHDNYSTLTAGDPSLPDTPFWKLHPPHFTTSSLYSFQKTNSSHISRLRHIWKLRTPPRMLTFAWQLLQDRIPTLDNLQRRGWHLPNRCILCAAAEESAQHITFHRPFFTQVCSRVYLLARITFPVLGPTSTLLLFLLPEKKQRELLLITCFVVWRERCNRIFNSSHKSPHCLADDAILEWKYCNNTSTLL